MREAHGALIASARHRLLEHAAQVADGARRAGRTIGHIVERLHGDDAAAVAACAQQRAAGSA